MHQDLKIKASELENIQYASEYIQPIVKEYYMLWNKEPDNFATNFTDDQHALLAYDILYNQVQNGGFLQLIFNGYYGYVFETPLSETLRVWGAGKTADILEKIKPEAFEVYSYMKDREKTVEELSDSYKQYPDFDGYDDEFYEAAGLLEVKSYVEKNLTDFIQIAE